MASELLRFRCFQCDKLLGVSPSKAGRVVSCPACKAELIVPEPEGESQSSEFTASLMDGGLKPGDDTLIGFEAGIAGDSPTSILLGPTPARPIFSKEPETSIDVSLSSLAALAAIRQEPTVVTPETLPTIAIGPVGSIRPPEPRTRSRDLAIPRGIVVAWSYLVLLAVLAAFGSGLLLGHYVWKLK